MERLGASPKRSRTKHLSRGHRFPHSRIADKYGMRPRTIIRRLLQERRLPEAPQKPIKWRTQPLSKYRKKAPATRQQSHVRQINQAFENLRNVLPAAASCRSDASASAKMTILRLAVRYIAALTHLLQEDDTQRCLTNDDDDDDDDASSSYDDHKPRASASIDTRPQESLQKDEDEASEDTYMLALAKIFEENSDRDEADYHSDSDDLLSRDLSDQEVEEQLEALSDLGHLSEEGTDSLSLS